jgi:hypothetical protein
MGFASERAVEGERQIATLELQERLARLSTRGRQATLEDSGSVIAAVREVVGYASACQRRRAAKRTRRPRL